MKNFLSFGGGFDSTALALMANEGLINEKLDGIIFANTGFEKRDTYKHIKELKSKIDIPFYTLTKSIFKETLKGIENDKRISSLPFFTAPKTKYGKVGRLKRQCTGDYKIRLVHQKIRDILGVKVLGKKDDVKVWVGFNASEPQRISKKKNGIKTNWETIAVPFYNVDITKYSITQKKYFDKNIHRSDIEKYCEQFNFNHLVKSGCKGCPNMSDLMWLEMKENNIKDWEDAVLFDKAIRRIPNVEQDCFLHRSCKPLDKVKFNPMAFSFGCVGECFT